jgi:hypothetical protein
MAPVLRKRNKAGRAPNKEGEKQVIEVPEEDKGMPIALAT